MLPPITPPQAQWGGRLRQAPPLITGNSAIHRQAPPTHPGDPIGIKAPTAA